MEFNSCAHLIDTEEYREAKRYYSDMLAAGIDPLSEILRMQNSLQTKLAETYPGRCKKPSELKTLGDKYDWIRDNKIAFDDEYSELISALGGMNKTAKDRSSLWKKWKSNHEAIRAEQYADLAPNEKLELLFECVDQVHFFANQILALEMSAEDIFCLYYAKNAENFKRYNSGY